MARRAEKRVGVFFIGAMVLLGVLAIFSEDLEFWRTGYELVTYFDSAENLLEHDPVTLGGVEVGKVVDMAIDGQRVRIALRLDPGTVVKKDSVAKIRMTTLLGGRFIGLTIGSPEAPVLKPGDVIDSVEPFDVDKLLTDASEITDDVHELIDSFNENQDKVLDKVYAMLDENEEGVSEAITAFRDAATTISDAGPKVDEILESVKTITARAERGEGTVGKLLADESLYEEMQEITANVKEVSETAKRLLADNEENVDELVVAARDASVKLNETLDSANEIADKINEGEGTIGKLVNDEELYDDARETLATVSDAAEGVREQTPITGFLSVLFGAFGG